MKKVLFTLKEISEAYHKVHTDSKWDLIWNHLSDIELSKRDVPKKISNKIMDNIVVSNSHLVIAAFNDAHNSMLDHFVGKTKNERRLLYCRALNMLFNNTYDFLINASTAEVLKMENKK